MADRYQRWQDLHPGQPPFQQSAEVLKSLLPPNYANRAYRRERTPLHGPNWHMKTRGKADTRHRVTVSVGYASATVSVPFCRCASAAAQARRGRITGLNVDGG